MSQFIFSGAANYINFDEYTEYQYSIGFGNAVRYMAREFNAAGLSFIKGTHKIDNMVNLAFCYPDEFDFLKSQYSIAYMPWESTKIWDNWIDPLKSVDEVWTTSDWSKNNLEGILDREVHIYEHGIPDFCVPRKRKRKEVFRFLHVGEPAVRKGAQDVVEAFIELFGNDPRYQLVLKCSNVNTTRIRDTDGQSIGTPPSQYSNILIIEDYFPDSKMLELYNKCDAFVYPSYGEGFGFNAAYAIATAMPTICTSEWAPYRDYITIPLDGTHTPTPWPQFHPGDMIQPDLNQMKSMMIDVSENYDKYLKESWNKSIGIHERFDWHHVSEKPIKKLKKIISMTSK